MMRLSLINFIRLSPERMTVRKVSPQLVLLRTALPGPLDGLKDVI